MTHHPVHRRSFITLLGGVAAAWPLAARAQQPAMPVVGFLASGPRDAKSVAQGLAAFRNALREAGFVDGRNVTVEPRWADGYYERLPGLAADFVSRKVAAIAAIGALPTVLAAKAATTTIPIIFGIGGDPVQLGLLASLSRPGGNLTGATNLNTEVLPKRLQLMHEVVPAAVKIALLVNPTNPAAEGQLKDAQVAARSLGRELQVLKASTKREIEAAFAARAQQPARVRRVGVLSGGTENSLDGQSNLPALREMLAKLGWIEGRNLRMEVRYGIGDPGRMREHAADLVKLDPDVIVTSTSAATRALQRQTQDIPIVITSVGDPVFNGFVKSLARPEGNITGFTNYYASMGGKWLELLKEAAPHVTRVALLYNPEITPASSYSASIEEAAPQLAVKAIKTPIRNAVEVVHAIDAFAVEPNSGLLPMPATVALRDTIVQAAAQNRLPAIYSDRATVAAGGLMGYASDPVDRFRRAATYVDRILRGAKVNELPVQFPTKFELVINLKTAKAIGLTIPEAFLLRADEIIE